MSSTHTFSLSHFPSPQPSTLSLTPSLFFLSIFSILVSSLYFLYSSFFSIFPVANLALHRSLVTLCFSLTPYFFLLLALSLSGSSSFSLFLYFFLFLSLSLYPWIFPLFLTDRLPHFFPSPPIMFPWHSHYFFPFLQFTFLLVISSFPPFFPPLPPMILGNKCDTSRARIEL